MQTCIWPKRLRSHSVKQLIFGYSTPQNMMKEKWHWFQNVIHSRSGVKRRFWPGNIEAAGDALWNGQYFEESVDLAARTVLPSALSLYYLHQYRLLYALSKVWLSKSQTAVTVPYNAEMESRANYSQHRSAGKRFSQRRALGLFSHVQALETWYS